MTDEELIDWAEKVKAIATRERDQRYPDGEPQPEYIQREGFPIGHVEETEESRVEREKYSSLLNIAWGCCGVTDNFIRL